ncbi:hypothetical protein B0H14DRAFT_2648510 [Mycena olivaceomarginata]|nr:hypothetical protein B0H14DRAFT_2648510 [Mycena olivaceomarginata]
MLEALIKYDDRPLKQVSPNSWDSVPFPSGVCSFSSLDMGSYQHGAVLAAYGDELSGSRFVRFSSWTLRPPSTRGARIHLYLSLSLCRVTVGFLCLFGKRYFTIFISGAFHRSIPISVQGGTTAREIYSRLAKLGFVPSNSSCFYFIYERHHLLWTDTVASAGLGPLSHLYLRLRLPGGGNPDDDEPSSSCSHRKRNTKRLDEFIQAEQLDEFGNPTHPGNQRSENAPVSPKSLRLSRIPTPRTRISRAEDSSSNDSDIEEVISNDEASRRRKSLKGKGKAVEPPVPSSSSLNTPSELNPIGAISIPAVAPNPPKPPRRKRNPIHYFFEEVDQHGDGSVEEGARYYKCYLGNRKVLKIGRKMNHNTHGATISA